MSAPRTSPFTSVRYAERRRGRSTTRVLLVVLVITLVVAVAGAATLWTYAATQMSGVPVTELARADDEAENTLVVTREADGTAGAIAVVQTSPLHPDQTRVLTFPVDLRVQVLGEGARRLGQFLADGDVPLLVDAIQRFTDDGDGNILPLDHYVLVDLPELEGLVTALGGVPDCEQPGQELCGRLAPARVIETLQRSGTPADDDPERVRAVHHVVRNTLAELRASAVLWRPLRTKELVDRWVATVETDRDLGPRSLARIADAIAATPGTALDVRVVPGTREDGVVTATPEQAQQLFTAFADPAEPLPADAGVEAPRELVPADITIRVLNGVGRSGLAGEVADFLSDKGFAIESTDNADRFDEGRKTEIAHAPGDSDRAELVAGYFPGAEVREVAADALPAGVDVVVTVGGDWSRA